MVRAFSLFAGALLTCIRVRTPFLSAGTLLTWIKVHASSLSARALLTCIRVRVPLLSERALLTWIRVYGSSLGAADMDQGSETTDLRWRPLYLHGTANMDQGP